MGVQLSSIPGPEEIYFNNLKEGRFVIQCCDSCNKAVFYPRYICPHCGGRSLRWFEPCGNATVYATTTVHPGRKSNEAYNVCLVDLDEGVRLMTRIADLPTLQVRIGMRVTAKVELAGDDARLVFTSAEDN